MPLMGADPELFIVEKSKPKIGVPSEFFLASKKDVLEDPWITEQVKVDNGALEINPEPSHCLQTLNGEIADCLLDAQRAFTYRKPQPLKNKTFCFSPRTMMKFKKQDVFNLASLGAFGCVPAKLCEAGVVSDSTPLVDPFVEHNRTAGYHIHVGTYDEYFRKSRSRLQGLNELHTFLLHPETNVKLVQHCDLFAGLVGVLIDSDPVNAWRRQTMGYGRAGEFRDQPHGFEYRVLSNFPLRHPILAWIMHCLVRDAYYASFLDLRLYDHINMSDVATAINTNNRDAAAEMWLELKHVLKKRWFDLPRIDSHPLLRRTSTLMFREVSIKKLEFFITHFPLKSVFSKICLKAWDSHVSAQGLDVFVTEKTRGEYEYACYTIGNRRETAKTKKMNNCLQRFDQEWKLLFDASLLRYF